MNKLLKVGVAGLALISASASAISISGQAGEKYTNIAVGFGNDTPGLTMNGNYAHNDDDGDTAGLGLGLNLPLGPLMGTVGGRAVYLNPNDGDEGYALAVGGGLSWKIFDSFSVFGDYYYSPDSLSSGVENYQEASAGARWTIIRPITIEAGYRYIGMENKNGERDNAIADGPYVGVSAGF
ncbi:YfaZ family protein [Buttiauxella sp. WJP83]|uniref:YfaZ family outer membrane protein n=1 Tax=Buttiauxella sp. WJP83 TaxID=2986951 RepID=UPI0022DD93D0|nr:YfaZ family outer membrane protein [Buttiauxella sp. WJP83]WBM69557.1 YfaZ family protein [Buttiauxella sp. WJP83]